MSTSIIFHYFNTLSTKQKEQFQQIAPLYKAWNKRLNLISRKDIDHLYLKHVLHALSIARVVTFQPGARILDVGTGGGFPGIPLAILFPQTKFRLIDSIGKKVHAVQQIAHELALSNVSTQQIRAEKIVGSYDFVLGRAVTNLVTFYNWVRHSIMPHHRHSIPNGILYLRGQGPVMLSEQHRIYPVQAFFEDSFFETKEIVHIMCASQQKKRTTRP